MIECEGESHRWSESYTRELVDLFTLYDEVAAAIARALDVVINRDRPESVAPPTRSREALMLVMQARSKLGETGNPRTLLPLVQRAVTLDPDYADAQLAMGQIHFALGENGVELPEPVVRAAQACVQKALLLDPESSEAHELLGSIRAYLDLDWSSAAESWTQGDRLRGYAKKYNRLCMAGYYEAAERSCRHVIDRDPLNIYPRLWLGRALDRLGRIDEATVEYEGALALQPRNLDIVSDALIHWLNFARDLERGMRFLDDTEYSGPALPWLRDLIAHAQGDRGSLRSLVEDRRDYWDRLTEWALADPAETRSRQASIH